MLMTLSEAIRLGALLRPQAFGALWHRLIKGDEELVSSCALGAAYDALGCGYDHPDQPPPAWLLSWFDRPAQCPRCRDFRAPRGIIVGHLNDRHYWTRQEIADWVQTLEAADEHQTPRVEVPVGA